MIWISTGLISYKENHVPDLEVRRSLDLLQPVIAFLIIKDCYLLILIILLMHVGTFHTSLVSVIE